MNEQNKRQDESNEPREELGFDAVDMMLDGNLKGQVIYSMIKAMATALDEKVGILMDAERGFESKENETFAEVALPEIEAMGQAVVEGCVDFSKIRFWEACETAEIAWEETKNDKGEVIQRMPYALAVEPARSGNRILANLEQIHSWLETSHQVHKEKGMGWISPYGCPEDGQQAFDRRGECLDKLNQIISSIKTNFEY